MLSHSDVGITQIIDLATDKRCSESPRLGQKNKSAFVTMTQLLG